jgi:hypothetical protein
VLTVSKTSYLNPFFTSTVLTSRNWLQGGCPVRVKVTSRISITDRECVGVIALIFINCWIKALCERLRWSLVPKVAGSNPAEAVEKILSTTSFGGEVKPSVPCRRFAACKTSLKWRGTRYFRPNYRKFLAQQVSPFAARISSVVVTWSLLAVKVGALNTHGVCSISLQAAVHPLTGPHTNKQTKKALCE